MAKTPRTWTGARTPSGLKRVRQAQSRHEVLQPRRSAAKTYVAKALIAAAHPAESTIDPEAALAEALSALDRVRHLEQPVGQRGLAMVDVGDDRKVAQACLRYRGAHDAGV